MIYYSLENDNAKLHSAAHKLLDYALKTEYGIESYTLGVGEHGKPFLADRTELHFNLSHCQGMVCCLTADCPCGVDCESASRGQLAAAKKFFSESERKMLDVFDGNEKKSEYFSRIWTLKEAAAKADGRGLYSELALQTFLPTDTPYFQNGFYTVQFSVKGFIISAAAEKFSATEICCVTVK